ncbi:unnamed protein product, partial [Ectocarpus fasciculatus]
LWSELSKYFSLVLERAKTLECVCLATTWKGGALPNTAAPLYSLVPLQNIIFVPSTAFLASLQSLCRAHHRGPAGEAREGVGGVPIGVHAVVVWPSASHPYQADTEQAGFSPDQALTSPSAKRREVFGESYSRWGGNCCLVEEYLRPHISIKGGRLHPLPPFLFSLPKRFDGEQCS